MSKHSRNVHQNAIAADPDQWSEQSKHSVAFYYTHVYTDEEYKCYRCGTVCKFTAQDQKYTFEVKKASIDQRRKFCSACWSASHRLRAALADHDSRWRANKSELRSDKAFLHGWLDLLTRWKQFEPYKLDVAKINMLRSLLELA